MKPSDIKVSKEKLVFASANVNLHDKELQTKPVGYLKDAFNRFKKNKASIVASFIILLLILFAIIGPIVSPYKVEDNDASFKYAAPKSKFFSSLNINFWDGCVNKTVNEATFSYNKAIGIETGNYVYKNNEYTVTEDAEGFKNYNVRVDTYRQIGVVLMSVKNEEYFNIQKYQDETGRQVIYPMTDKKKRPLAPQDNMDGNFWYQTKKVKGKTVPVLDKNGDYINIYRRYSNGFDKYTSKMRIEENGEKLYDYALVDQTGYSIRVDYYEYYAYYNSYVKNNGITEPLFLFGATSSGQDLFTCLASGARFSLFLAVVVASINLFVGAIYGAIEGYYGGKIDLAMERIIDILGAIPFMIVISLLKFYGPGQSQALLLFIAFFLTGWIGMASRTRMQFYRFKNQEYVLAARTLGASDRRIMFGHIFPNALGTLITSSVLVIPGVIFSETSLSYLGIINLNTGSMTSVGTLLSNGQQSMVHYPFLVFFPSVFISLLMLSFNLFGNGLRDAFNPSLRGTGE